MKNDIIYNIRQKHLSKVKVILYSVDKAIQKKDTPYVFFIVTPLE